MGLGADTDISQQKFGSDLGIGSGRGVEEVKKMLLVYLLPWQESEKQG